MTYKQAKIYTQARMMATDVDLMRIFELTPEGLERHRRLIDRARGEAIVALRDKRARATAEKAKQGA